MSKYSENEDDPEIYESSGDEWKQEDEEKTSNRRLSQRLSKKPRKTVVEIGSSDEDSDSENERKRMKAKNGVAKKVKCKKEDDDDDFIEDEGEDEEAKQKFEKSSQNSVGKIISTTTTATVPASRGIHRKFIPKTIFSEDYATGSFVILKKDAQVGDPSKHPCIWRIDGKALLQKYEAFDEDGKVRHKNTSIYTGWSPMDKDLYAPITVDVILHNNQNLTVELHWDKLKDINVDSD
ncbi:unnamed protein product [Psylliodes chrysocephalus]|uniref:Uncharacterized protein n=1 Tax=Psylliodes chrysocephalus TaxID=3402493 RepID=A0A9P0GBJ8_9CUCU|nr:unnamed protein product [Psylliodes chrysocephala]